MRACIFGLARIVLLLCGLGLAHPCQSAEPAACGPDTAGSPCGEEQVAGLPGTGGVPQGVGNPVNLITGNKHQRETDMAALPGVLGLELVRHYNSQLARPGMPLYGIGRGWQFSYDTRLHAHGRMLRIEQADGARRIFARASWSTRVYSSADPAEGIVRVMRSDDALHYRWRWPDGRELGFDRNGRLRRIALPGGEALVIGRLADGRLATVTDPQGRSLAFHYLAHASYRPGRLSAVQYVDTPVGRIRYAYGDTVPAGASQQAENLVAVHLPTRHEPGRLRSLDGRGDRPADYSRSTLRRRYHYEDPRFPTLLTGISVTGAGSDGRDIDWRIARWAYDGNGLAVLSASGAAAQKAVSGDQPPAGAGLLRLDRRTPGHTTVTDGDGRVTIYRHAIVGGAFRLLEARGAGCERCGPVNIRYRYDSLGRLEEVTRLDERGMPIEGRRDERDAMGLVVASKTVQYARGREVGRSLVLRRLYPPAGMASASRGSPPAGRQGPKQLAMRSVLAGHDHTTEIDYNQRQQPLKVTESGYNPVDGSRQTRTTRYRYEEVAGRSLLVEVDGPLPNGPAGTPADSDITRYEWDAQGTYLRRIRHPMGALTELEQDPHSGRLAVLTLRWERTVRQLRYTHDPQGQVERVRERALEVDGVTVLGERELSLRRDALGRPSVLVEADGTVRELGSGGPAGAPAGMPAAAPAGTAGNPAALATHRMSPPGDSAGGFSPAAGMLRPTQLGDLLTAAAHEALRFDAHGRSAERRIDDFGQVVAIRNPGQGWQHARYDEAGRLVEIRDPRGATTLARYDAAGRLLRIERALPGDPSERLDLVWRGPERLSETVTIAGRQTHATHYRRNPWGQVSRMQVEIAGIDGGAPVRMSLQSRHDAAGRLIARTLPGGERLAWRYYASAPYRGQQAAIERIHWPVWLDGLMTRLPEAWLDSWRWKTRIATLAPRDNEAALQSSSAPDTAALSAMPDAAPRAEPGLSAEAPGSDHDAAGLPHRLRTSKGELALRWNAAGQLVEVRAADAEGGSPPLARYRYDARGRRASKHTAGGGEYYLHEGTQLVAAVKMDRHGRRSLGQYLYEGYRAIAWLHDGVAYALQTDHRGALTEVQSLQDDGKPVKTLWRAQLDAWGKRPSSAAASPHDPGLRLLNQYADDETGLSYHIARYYHPGQGRFISPDPAGIADTLSADVPPALQLDLTAYVAGQPWHYVDPDGAARLIYYAITTNAKGKPLGTTQGFTRARWAFSIDGIEASGDGGSDAINGLMEKYAKNQTGLLFDGGGDYLTGGKKAVSWNGAADETVDGFRRHYGGNLIGLANFTIENFSNRDAALLVASLMKDTKNLESCPLFSELLPIIRFAKEEIPIEVGNANYVSKYDGSEKTVLANMQRIVVCGTAATADADLRRIKKYNYAAMLLENVPPQIDKDCSSNGGCPGKSLRNTSLRGYVASYGATQFTITTMISTLEKMRSAGVDIVSRGTRELLQLDSSQLWLPSSGSGKSEVKKANEYGLAAIKLFNERSVGAPDWERADRVEKDDFMRKTGLTENVANSLWNDINKWKRSPEPNLNGEARAAIASFVILQNQVVREYLIDIFKDTAADGRFNMVSEYLLKINLNEIKNQIDASNKFSERTGKGEVNPEWQKRQQEIEIELAARVARLHNGDLCATPVANCTPNVARTGSLTEVMNADKRDAGRQYARRFINISDFPIIQPSDPGRQKPVGNYFSLRCAEKFAKESNVKSGLEMMPLSI